MIGQEIMDTNLNRKRAQKKAESKNPMPDRAVKNLADSIFKTLCDEGCDPKDIIGVSSQLLSLVTSELEKIDSPS